ncbi:MAG: hypothetical protein ABIA47_04580 [bacterium]
MIRLNMTAFAKTAFYVSIISYAVFAFADYLRPGFVSYVFSVHWFGVAALVFGVAWGYRYRTTEGTGLQKGRSRVLRMLMVAIVKIAVGLALLIVIWREGAVFEDLRVFIALVAFFLPWVVPAILGESKVEKRK